MDRLASCYGDASESPTGCETEFQSRLLGLTVPYYETSLSSQNNFDSGMSQLGAQIGGAQALRDIASWAQIYGVSFSASWYVGVSFSFGPVAADIANMNPFNSTLYAARLQRICSFWVEAWDAGSCSG